MFEQLTDVDTAIKMQWVYQTKKGLVVSPFFCGSREANEVFMWKQMLKAGFHPAIDLSYPKTQKISYHNTSIRIIKNATSSI